MFTRRITTPSVFSDEELIRQYQLTRDPAYIGDLFSRYTHLIYGICLKYFGDEEDSKDAVMQIFEKLLQTLKTQEVNKFNHWLHILTKNYCLMELRSKKIKEKKSWQHNLPDFPQTTNDLELEAFSEKELKLHHLELGLTQIPAEQKICIELFYLEKKCYQEITEITGFDLNKVKSYIQNGKRNLKIYLEKHHD